MVEATRPKSASQSGKEMPTNKFTKNILRTMVGEERAAGAFASISMGAIPNADSLSRIGNNGKGS